MRVCACDCELDHRRIMPGPTLRLAGSVGDSNDFSVFESCDDIQEAWGGLNGNFSAESIYHECTRQEGRECRDVRVNGDPLIPSTVTIKVPEYSRTVTFMAETRSFNASAATGRERVASAPEMTTSQIEGLVEDMEVEDEVVEEAVETINLPVVSASLSLDLNTSLTRQKISSVQRGRTLSYADQDDAEESPTRRHRPLIHANESIDVGTPLHSLPAKPTSPTSPTTPQSSQEPISPSLAQRAARVARNPSYHFAVRDAAIVTPKSAPKPQSTEKGSRSCDSSPIRPQMEPLREESPVEESSSQRRHVSESDGFITIPLASNMSRSVSFSGAELLSPATAASGSLSEGNSRSGSVPQLSSAPAHSSAPILESKSPPPTFTRGSVISRSFRRLFSTPSRTPPANQPEECWDDVPGVHNTSEGEVKSSRLRRISSSFSRKLTTKPKMSGGGGSGTNGQHIVMPNGSTSPEDARSLVEYEDLLKLFCCSGCQSFMVPPLHQCRKGHLVCNSCRFSLKQACPTCKQRFSESTNMMMEQVCQLVKFPCKYAAQGCPEFHRPRAKQDHEHFCSYRPVHCHHGPQGCPKVLLLRDMHQHLEQCDFKKK